MASISRSGADPHDHRRDWLIAFVVIICAFLVRLIYLLQYRSCPYFFNETMDPGFHAAWAKAIASGESFIDGPYFRAPLYPWFLGALFKILGDDLFTIRLVQMAIGSLSCGLVYLVGRQLFGRIVSATAAFATAIYWTLVYFDGELLIPSLIIFFDLLLIWSLLRFGRRKAIWPVLLPGILLGLSAIARPNILIFAPAVALWLALPLRDWKKTARRSVVFCISVAAVIAPVTIRNALVGEDLVLISSQGGVNFYIGNNPRADGVTINLPGVEPTIEGLYRGSAVLAESQTGRTLKPSEVSDHYFSKAIDFFRSQPADAGRLMLRKAALFWTHLELMNNRNLYFLTDRYAPITRFLPIGFWIAGPLGVLGLVASFRRRYDLFPLWGFVMTYMVSVILFFVTARFRLPVVPILLLLGVYGVGSLLTAFRERCWRWVAAMAAGLAAGLLLAAAAPTVSPKAEEWAIVDLSKALASQGRSDEAITLLEEAITRHPTSSETIFSLGVAYQAANRIDAAMQAYERALRIEPEKVPALNNLASIHLSSNRPEAAIRHLERAVAIDPLHSGAWFNLGRAYTATGRHAEAVVSFERGLAIQPGRSDILTNLAWLRAATDDPAVIDCDKARAAAEEAVRLTKRADHSALDALAAANARCGEFTKAVQLIDEAIRIARTRGDRRALSRFRQLREIYGSGRLPGGM